MLFGLEALVLDIRGGFVYDFMVRGVVKVLLFLLLWLFYGDTMTIANPTGNPWDKPLHPLNFLKEGENIPFNSFLNPKHKLNIIFVGNDEIKFSL